jgi:hypothetical protein
MEQINVAGLIKWSKLIVLGIKQSQRSELFTIERNTKNWTQQKPKARWLLNTKK